MNTASQSVLAMPTPAATASATPASSASTRTTRPSATAGAETCAAQSLDSLSEHQRIGQLFMLGLAGDRLGDAETTAIANDHIGSVWFVERSAAGVTAIHEVATHVQDLASQEITGGIGFYIAANQEGGVIQSLQGPGFSTIPSAVEQGARDLSLLEADSLGWGAELQAAGVNFNFAPVMDVVPPEGDATNEPIGALDREYGHDPAGVATHAVAFVRGMLRAGVATTAKHFPGLGRVEGNTDFSADVVDGVTERDDPYLRPFADAIDAGTPAVMVALATYTHLDPERLAVFSPTVIRGILRTELGFDGLVISDDLGATAAVAEIPEGDRAVDFLAAGGDVVISKTVDAAAAMYEGVLARADVDAGFRQLVDVAALRVLTAKAVSGLVPGCSGG